MRERSFVEATREALAAAMERYGMIPPATVYIEK